MIVIMGCARPILTNVSRFWPRKAPALQLEGMLATFACDPIHSSKLGAYAPPSSSSSGVGGRARHWGHARPILTIVSRFWATQDSNPDFHHAHHVRIPYCTGDSHAGTAVQEGLYLMGHSNFVRMIHHIAETIEAWSSATHILLWGAGGKGVLVNCVTLRDFSLFDVSKIRLLVTFHRLMSRKN